MSSDCPDLTARENETSPMKRLEARGWSFKLLAPLYFAAFTVVMFNGLLINSGRTVISCPGNDITTSAYPCWYFGFSEMAQGRLPLWNPHVLCGSVFLANWNSALLYPINWLNLILPTGQAINWIVAIHFFMAGWIVSLWCRYRGLGIVASLLGGTCFMLGGPFYLHIFPGHTQPLAAMVWTPLLLLCVDGLVDTASPRWAMLGMGAVAMQILASFHQAVYYTGLVCALYGLLRLIRARQRGKVVLLALSVYAGGVMLSAVQLLPGLAVAGESVRAGGTNFTFASSCSLPPENLLTMVMPAIFGDLATGEYFGRWYAWEVNVFFGVAAMVLAGYGAIFGPRSLRRYSLVLAILFMVLALGANTPLYKLMYKYFPMYNNFRTTSRHAFIASLFVSMLAAIGFDTLKKQGRGVLIAGAITVALAAVAFGLSRMVKMDVARSVAGHWAAILQRMVGSGGEVITPIEATNPDVISKTGLWVSGQFLTLAGMLLIAGVLMVMVRHSRRWAYGLALLAGIELTVFACRHRLSGPADFPPYPMAWTEFHKKLQPDERVLHPTLGFANTGMVRGTLDLCGYEPFALKRYGRLMAASQNITDTGDLNFIPPPARVHPIFSMLRCRYVFFVANNQPIVLQIPDPMPRLSLIQNYQVQTDYAAILKTVTDPKFNPRETVVLESEPFPKPASRPSTQSSTQPAAVAGSVKLVRQTTDELEIEAELPQAAILLITDSYAKDWRVDALPGSVQQQYQLLPANYALRAIPLTAGRHHFLVYYLPNAFVLGKWITICSVLPYLLVGYATLRKLVP